MKKICGLVFLFIFVLTACNLKPTPKPLPTNVSKQPTPKNPGGSNQENFSLKNADQVVPNNVIEEIVYYGTGGDVGCPETAMPMLAFMASKTTEPYQKITIFACGFQLDETVTVQIRDSLNTVSSNRNQAGYLSDYNRVAGTKFNYYPENAGDLEITATGANGGSASETIDIIMPTQPRMYLTEDNRVVFYNLQGNEEIGFYAYRINHSNNSAKFEGWQYYRADSNGFLSIDVPNDDLLIYYANGEYSGFLKNGNGSTAQNTIFK